MHLSLLGLLGAVAIGCAASSPAIKPAPPAANCMRAGCPAGETCQSFRVKCEHAPAESTCLAVRCVKPPALPASSPKPLSALAK